MCRLLFHLSLASLLLLQEELHDYYRLLAVLEQEARRTSAALISGIESGEAPLHVVSNKHSGGNRHTSSTTAGGGPLSSGVEMDAGGGTSGLTLLRLKAWMQEPIER